MFVRVIRSGYELAYEPSAIVWHVHLREDDLLANTSTDTAKASRQW